MELLIKLETENLSAQSKRIFLCSSTRSALILPSLWKKKVVILGKEKKEEESYLKVKENMTSQFDYSYPWPLEGYEGLEPLSE